MISPFDFEDPDSTAAVFNVQLASICGTFSLLNFASCCPSLSVSIGTGENDAATSFSGLYSDVRRTLQNISFRASGSCDELQHSDLISLRIVNTANPAHNVSSVIAVDIVPVNSPPEVLVGQYPRWTLRGLNIAPSADVSYITTSVVKYPPTSYSASSSPSAYPSVTLQSQSQSQSQILSFDPSTAVEIAVDTDAVSTAQGEVHNLRIFKIFLLTPFISF